MFYLLASVLLILLFYFIPASEPDLIVPHYDKNISTIDLLIRLNMTSAPFDIRNICATLKYSCIGVCPLDKEDQERVNDKPCYCDKLCVELGDCCFDYFMR